jgi:type VI secretion system protein VasD
MPRTRTLACMVLGLLLSGCSALSPYSSMTKLELSLAASEDLNPDIHGRPSPIVLRLMELKHPVAFENADFFSLYERPQTVLAVDLVNTEELELSPGKQVELKLSVQPSSHYVAVLAAYRDLPETQWRYVIPLKPAEINRTHLILDQHGVHLPVDPKAVVEDKK